MGSDNRIDAPQTKTSEMSELQFEAAVKNLLRAAGQAGDTLQVVLCEIALHGLTFDWSEYPLDKAERDQLRRMQTREEAIALCAEAIDDAAGR